MNGALRPLVDRIAELAAALRGVPHFEWGTVTTVNPVRVQLDGDEVPLAGSLSSLVGNLTVGVRVRVELQNRRATIVGRADNTDWANVSVPGATGTCQWRRQAGVIWLRFDVTFSTAIAAGGTASFSVPAVAAPGISTPLAAGAQGTFSADATVEPNGAAAIRNTDGSARTRFKGSGSWPAEN